MVYTKKTRELIDLIGEKDYQNIKNEVESVLFRVARLLEINSLIIL